MTLARVVEFRTAIDPPWTHFEPVRVGAVPPSLGTPGCYVLVSELGMPALRVDIYGDSHGINRDATTIGEWLAIGIGRRLYLVSLKLPRPRPPREMELPWGFGGFFPLPTERSLLVASGRDVRRIDRSGRVVWTSPMIAVDGVQIERVHGDLIEGTGQWDPPDGWRPFRIRLADGQPA